MSFDRLLALLAIAALVGMIVGWGRGRPRTPRVRLFSKPTKTPLSVLVPPGPAPRLIPSDSPKATRARSPPRPTRANGPRFKVVDYLAAFADSPEASQKERVDYLLVSSDSEEEPPK